MEQKFKTYSWSQKDLIGHGAFGKVYLGSDSRELTKNNIVVKEIDYKSIYDQDLIKVLFKYEQLANQKCKSSFTSTYRDIYIQRPKIYIMSEFQNGGDLRKLINKNNGNPFSEKKAIQILQDILKGMKVIVTNKFIHRDLKMDNIFIDKDIYKVADFGFCEPVEDENQIFWVTCGSPGYTCPQIVRRQSYTIKCDIWSLGTIYYEMLFGTLPGHGSNDIQRIDNIQKQGLKFPAQPQISEISRNFLKGCLQIDEENRWDWATIFSSEINQSDVLNQDESSRFQNIIQLKNSELEFCRELSNRFQHDVNFQSELNSIFTDKQINFEQWKFFCEKQGKSDISYNLFKYFDFNNINLIQIDEVQYRLSETNFETNIDYVSEVQVQHLIKKIINEINIELDKQLITADKFFETIDLQKKNELDLIQFTNLLNKISLNLNQYETQIIFNYIDVNRNKSIGLREFINVFILFSYWVIKEIDYEQ